MQHNLLINGELIAGSGEKQPVYNPATGEVLLEIAEASPEQVDAAVQAADRAFRQWGQTTPKARAECLLKLADVIEQNADTFARLESLNCGKPLHYVLNDEIPAIVDVFRFFAGATRCLNGLAAGEYMEGHTSMIRRDPVGVVASIAPWNYPLMMAAWKLGPALAAGNCVVLKPSEITPLTALKLAELAKDIFPAGVINVLFGRGKTVGDPLTGHDKVRMVSLTGSIATGEHILWAIPRPRLSAPIWSWAAKHRSSSLTTPTSTQWWRASAPLVFTMPDRTAPRPVVSMRKKRSITRWWRSWASPWPA